MRREEARAIYPDDLDNLPGFGRDFRECRHAADMRTADNKGIPDQAASGWLKQDVVKRRTAFFYYV